METHPITGPLNAAAESLSNVARNIGARSARLRDSLQADQARKQLMRAAEELRDAAHDATESARRGAAPYARRLATAAREQFAGLRDRAKTGSSALTVQPKRRGVIRRHPYATALLAAGACFVAIRQFRNGNSASANGKSPVKAKASNGGASTRTRRRASSKKPRRSSASPKR